MDIGTIVALVIAGISAIATVVIATFTYITIQAYEEQVQIGQEQVRVSQDQQFNQFRPVLYPVGGLGNITETLGGKPHIRWGYANQMIDGLRNIGVGPAFNIYGILFGPPLLNSLPPRERYVVWNYPALSPGETGARITLEQSTNVRSETTIEGYPLYVPDNVDHIGVIARFTLTYHDVFGGKHASIYDYHSRIGWRSRGHFPNIDFDIRELDRQTPGTQLTEEFFYAVGKRAQA